MYFIYAYYFGVFLMFHTSINSIILFPHFCQKDQNLSSLNSEKSSSKSNYSILKIMKKRDNTVSFYYLRINDSYQIEYDDGWNSTLAIESGLAWNRIT